MSKVNRTFDARSAARERSVHLLYEAESRTMPLGELITSQILPVDGLVNEMTNGVADNQIEIDSLISEFSQTWTIERMPAVDRNILRVAIYELKFRDVPTAVILNEAVELANRFSTDESGRYINGVLASIAKKVRAKGS